MYIYTHIYIIWAASLSVAPPPSTFVASPESPSRRPLLPLPFNQRNQTGLPVHLGRARPFLSGVIFCLLSPGHIVRRFLWYGKTTSTLKRERDGGGGGGGVWGWRKTKRKNNVEPWWGFPAEQKNTSKDAKRSRRVTRWRPVAFFEILEIHKRDELF